MPPGALASPSHRRQPRRQRLAGPRQLPPHQQHQQEADQQEDQRGDGVLQADRLVVGHSASTMTPMLCAAQLLRAPSTRRILLTLACMRTRCLTPRRSRRRRSSRSATRCASPRRTRTTSRSRRRIPTGGRAADRGLHGGVDAGLVPGSRVRAPRRRRRPPRAGRRARWRSRSRRKNRWRVDDRRRADR